MMLDARPYPDLDAVPARRAAVTRSRVLVGVMLIVVLLLGGFFRFTGLNWDDYTHLHPDERFLTSVASGLGRPLSPVFMNVGSPELNQLQYARCLERYPQNEGTGGYFDAECSTLNPHNIGHGLYVYGTLPLFLTRWTAELIVEYTGDGTWVGYDGIHLVWRFLSALSDMIAIVFVFWIGVYLHGKWVGLVAAALYAGSVFAIQQAHFGTADAMTNLFVVITIFFAVRVQLGGALADYALFGLAFGAALAGRVNVAPLAGLVILAAMLRAAPVLDRRLAWGERERALTGNLVGLVIAGVVTLVCFRVFNPYAFTGPGFFGLAPNPAWLADIGEAQHLVSGAAEMPPNWQWVGRPAYIFPWLNMVLWGMGAALGLAGWASWLWSGWRLARGRQGATLNLLLFVWVLVYFVLFGRQWVTTMRYFLPMYPALALLAAWGLVELVQRARGFPVRRFLARLLAVGVVGLTLLWAAMFTNIYRHQLTSVQAGNWVWENAPGDFSMAISGAEDGVPLINIAFVNGYGVDGDLVSQASSYADGQMFMQGFTAPASGMITSVHAPHLGELTRDESPETIRVSVLAPGASVPLAQGTLTANVGDTTNVIGESYDIPLDTPLIVSEGSAYTFQIEVVSGGPLITSGAIFSWEGDWDEVAPAKVCTLPPGISLVDDPPPGLVSPQDCNGRDPWGSLINGYKLQIIYDDGEFKRDLMQTALDNSDYIIIGSNRRYDSQNRNPAKWPMTQAYYDALFSGELGFELAGLFQETFELGPLQVSDQYLPIYDAPDWLNEFEAEEAFHVYDHPVLFIYRKTAAYSAENTAAILGSVPLTGVGAVNFACPDAQDLPGVNFYCDATLPGITPLKADLLDVSMSADASPLELQFSDAMRDVQYANGSWHDRFDSDSILNTQPILTVVIWWLAIILFGWAIFPLLFALLPGLADRGYGFAKVLGMFVTAWLAWFISSARIPVWWQGGVLACLLIVTVVSVFVASRSRASIASYLAAHWKRLALIEVITLIAFVVFLGVRLSNPDLWHPGYGGEKPMDFAYFNGVLRSTVFPPVDPWYANGYINYYYFGYVIVGAPVLLLGIVPSIAYNLIVPTLFAVTGIGAFSVAFNIVSAWRERQPTDDEGRARTARAGNPWVAGVMALLLAVVFGNLDTPRIITGELAELGGYTAPPPFTSYILDQYIAERGTSPTDAELTSIVERAQSPRLSDRVNYELSNFGAALRSVASGVQALSQGRAFGVSPDRWFWGPTRVLAEPPVDSGQAITEMPYFTFLYGDLHAHMIAMPLQLFVMAFLLNELLMAEHERRTRLSAALALGLGALVTGMLRATNTWDWVTFTILGVVGLSFAWWVRWHTSRDDMAETSVARRGVLMLAIFFAVVGLVGNMLYVASGSSVSLLTLAPFGLGVFCFAWWLLWYDITRRSLVSLVLRVGGFVVIGAVLSLPFTTWFAATYNRVLPWTGNRTPVWAYFDIHGLFLFLIFSLLVWDTGRWARSVYVRSLRGKGRLLVVALLFVVVTGVGAGVIATDSYQVALIVMPMLVWIAFLFFRVGQNRPMQFVLALAGLALALTLAVEVVVLDGDIGRQNTVFKFYIQVWLLFSVTGGAAFAWLIRSSERWSIGLRGLWYVVVGILIFVAAMFPFMATPGKAAFRMAPDMPVTLDGMAFLRYATQYEGSPAVINSTPGTAPFALADDYQVIRWLQENVQGTPVIMEGRSEREYLWGSRISIYTGLPSVVGWNWHQRQQRTFNPLPRVVEQRVANVNAFYVSMDVNMAWDMLRFYDVSYVIVSGLERAYYPAESLAKFDRMVDMGLLEIAYQHGNAVIYRVNKGASLEQGNELAGLAAS